MTLGKFIFYCLLLVGAVYCAVTLHPAIFFGNNYAYKNMTLYTHDTLKEPPDKLLASVHDKIAADDFYDADQNFEIYLAGGSFEYAFLAPSCANKFACAHPVTDKVFVALSDIDKGLSYPPGGGGVGRDLSGVIVHEAVKVQLKHKLGTLTYILLPDWKKEGYAEHIAMETHDINSADFCSAASAEDPALAYLKNRLIVELVSSEDRLGYPALMDANYSYDSVKPRVEERYCGRRL